MTGILATFRNRVHGWGTRQINPWYCVPAVASNASRILGFDACTQDWITAEWRRQHPVDAQGFIPARESGPAVLDVLNNSPEYSAWITIHQRSEASDREHFDPAKAERALQFIVDEVNAGHPVLASTVAGDGWHMLLILETDRDAIIFHDSGNDAIDSLALRGDGLFDRLATSDYYCASFRNA